MSAEALLVCLVVGVADGDTVAVEGGNLGAHEQVRIRLAAIEATEKRQPLVRCSPEKWKKFVRSCRRLVTRS